MADPSPEEGCCGPNVFTSVLLGVLACVLMTGGVFLAFHRWDPLWLIVSLVGVVLVLIGSVLHCCRTPPPGRGKGGCCLPDHLHNHVVLNGGSLTEQLLPLSNARSVSQLSLNMLPGYFPPVVTAYGIEQHSTVVQNINRTIQQQTGRPPPEKNYILLSLPTNTPTAKIQSLVATVYQLDGSVLTDAAADVPPPAVSAQPTQSDNQTSNANNPQGQSPPLKDAEVQTCGVWPVPVASPGSSSNVLAEAITAPMSTQTDAIEITIDLLDCLPSPLCDPAVEATLVTADTDNTSSVLVDVSTEEPIVDSPSHIGDDPAPIVENAITDDTNDLPDDSHNDPTDSLLDGECPLDRASPPPRYEDVALEGENSIFGLAYGTL